MLYCQQVQLRYMTTTIPILLQLLLVLFTTITIPTVVVVAAAAAREQQNEEDVMKTFDWQQTNCTDYPFGSLYDYCGVLEFCLITPLTSTTPTKDTNNNNNNVVVDEPMYGYRQEFDPICTSPGPIIRLQPGKKFLLTLRSTVLNVQTNIHTHGVHVSGDGNADNVKRIVNYQYTIPSSTGSSTTSTSSSGECIHYSWHIPNHHSGGTFWYHAHITTQSTGQVGKGAMGMMIVEDTYETLVPQDISNRNSIISFLQQQNGNNEKKIMASKIYNPGSVIGTWYANGRKDGARIILQQQVWTRIRIAISDPIGFSQQLSISSNVCHADDMIPIAYDGIYKRTISNSSSKLPKTITSASRIDIAIKCNNIGTATIYFGTSPIGHITVIETTPTIINNPDIFLATPFAWDRTEWIPNRPSYLRDLSTNTTTVDRTLSIELVTNPNTGEHTINGKNYLSIGGTIGDPGGEATTTNTNTIDLTPNYLDTYTLGQVIEWNVTGTKTHPLHLHVHHFQLMSSCGFMEIGEYYDTIQANNDNETCIIRFALEDYDGLTMLHCHDLKHEDMGMSVLLNVVSNNSLTTSQGTTTTTTANTLYSTVGFNDPTPSDRVCYTTQALRKECFFRTNAPVCTNRLGRDGRWIYKGINPNDPSCIEKCTIDLSIKDGENDGWKCGRCVVNPNRTPIRNKRLAPRTRCNDITDSCIDSLGRNGYRIYKESSSLFNRRQCQDRCENFQSLERKVKQLGWKCGKCP